MRYLVFARKAYAEPLRYQGALEAEGNPKGKAEQAFGEEWLEVVLVPEAAVRWVVREREEVARG